MGSSQAASPPLQQIDGICHQMCCMGRGKSSSSSNPSALVVQPSARHSADVPQRYLWAKHPQKPWSPNPPLLPPSMVTQKHKEQHKGEGTKPGPGQCQSRGQEHGPTACCHRGCAKRHQLKVTLLESITVSPSTLAIKMLSDPLPGTCNVKGDRKTQSEINPDDKDNNESRKRCQMDPLQLQQQRGQLRALPLRLWAPELAAEGAGHMLGGSSAAQNAGGTNAVSWQEILLLDSCGQRGLRSTQETCSTTSAQHLHLCLDHTPQTLLPQPPRHVLDSNPAEPGLWPGPEPVQSFGSWLPKGQQCWSRSSWWCPAKPGTMQIPVPPVPPSKGFTGSTGQPFTSS